MKYPLDPFEYENGYNHTAQPSRLAKVLAHYELYKKILDVPGAIVECGVFKGSSLIRWAMLRSLFETADAREIIAFDTFGKFPTAGNEADKEHTKAFTDEAGDESISTEELIPSLEQRGLRENISFIKGDICKTVLDYTDMAPELKIALLHIDVDLYEPTDIAITHLYDQVVKGGVIVMDDYGTFPGETQAIDEHFERMEMVPEIKKFPFSKRPSYIVV